MSSQGSTPSPGSRRGGGPRLDAADWIVLLDIYLRHRGRPIGTSHPDVQYASRLLSSRAEARGRAREGAVLRSGHGLVRRLTVLRALDRGHTAGAPVEARRAWERFSASPANCAAAAASIARSFDHSSDDLSLPQPSRGPIPFTGQYLVDQCDGLTKVYVMELAGPSITKIDEAAAASPDRYMKIGRSNDVRRRESELNEGFPPGLGLRWRCIFTRQFATGAEAHAVEQTILSRLAEFGKTIGGEFAKLAPREITALVEEESGLEWTAGPAATLKDPRFRGRSRTD